MYLIINFAYLDDPRVLVEWSNAFVFLLLDPSNWEEGANWLLDLFKVMIEFYEHKYKNKDNLIQIFMGIRNTHNIPISNSCTLDAVSSR